MATPDQHREVESKYDVDESFAVPPLEGLVPGGAVGVETVRLASTYFDTDTRALLGTRLTLRRRTGDTDTGWQLKVPDGDARIELRWPLGAGRGVPVEVRDVTLGVRGRAALRPVATLAVEREVHRLIDEEGRCLADVVRDTVTATATGRPASTWHEVEVELVDGGPDVLRSAHRVLRKAGARPSASASKLARALGTSSAAAYPKRSLARVVGRYLDAQWEAIVRGDLDLRRGELPVHATRTAIRRYRSVLRILEPVLDADRATALDGRLREFALALGVVRDNDVLRDVFDELIDELPAAVDAAAVRRRLDEQLDGDHDAATTQLASYLRSTRHADLLAELRAWHAALPIDATRPAGDALRFVARADKRARKRLGQVPDDHGPDDERMHRARKAAKRARYVAELAGAPGVGDATRTAEVARRNKKVQQRLGSRQDGAVAAAFLARLADDAGPATFGLGVLYRICLDHAAD